MVTQQLPKWSNWTGLPDDGTRSGPDPDSLGPAPAPEGGPMKIMPFSFNVAGSLGFSLACPQPGQTASTWSVKGRQKVQGTTLWWMFT